MNPEQWTAYKIDLERKAQDGDDSALKELAAVIIEETANRMHRNGKPLSPQNRKHLTIMKKLFTTGPQSIFSASDWARIERDEIRVHYTDGIAK